MCGGPFLAEQVYLGVGGKECLPVAGEEPFQVQPRPSEGEASIEEVDRLVPGGEAAFVQVQAQGRRAGGVGLEVEGSRELAAEGGIGEGGKVTGQGPDEGSGRGGGRDGEFDWGGQGELEESGGQAGVAEGDVVEVAVGGEVGGEVLWGKAREVES